MLVPTITHMSMHGTYVMPTTVKRNKQREGKTLTTNMSFGIHESVNG